MLTRSMLLSVSIVLPLLGSEIRAGDSTPIDIGNHRELFVDYFLIDKLDDVRLVLNRPRDEGPVVRFDQPWEGLFCGYCTMIKDGDRFLAYYRGRPEAGADGDPGEVYCLAESNDGIHWKKPQLDLFPLPGHDKTNIILAKAAPVTHNFCPMLDTRPGVPAEQRFKAIGGTMTSGLVAWASPTASTGSGSATSPCSPSPCCRSITCSIPRTLPSGRPPSKSTSAISASSKMAFDGSAEPRVMTS